MGIDRGRLLRAFVAPLLRGGGAAVHVAGPVRPRAYLAMVGARADAALEAEVEVLRGRLARRLHPSPALPPVDVSELSLWVALVDLLALDHPERDRVWSRPAAWGRVHDHAAALLTVEGDAPRTDPFAALARHVTLEALLALEVPSRRAAPHRRPQGGGWRLRGARLALAGDAPPGVPYLETSRAPAAEELLARAVASSPLTTLLHPGLAFPGVSFVGAARVLVERPLLRALCHAWSARQDWVALGGRVAAGLLRELEAGDADRQAARTLMGALVHLHLLRVARRGATTRLGGAGAEERGELAFLALPILAARHEGALGSPAAGGPERLQRGWQAHLDHLRALVSRRVVDTVAAEVAPLVA